MLACGGEVHSKTPPLRVPGTATFPNLHCRVGESTMPTTSSWTSEPPEALPETGNADLAEKKVNSNGVSGALTPLLRERPMGTSPWPSAGSQTICVVPLVTCEDGGDR